MHEAAKEIRSRINKIELRLKANIPDIYARLDYIWPGRSFPVPLVEIQHAPLQAMYRYWLNQRGDCTMPARRNIEPRDIRALLPHVFLVDVMPAGRYRFRLVGTHIVEHIGDVTGQYLDEAASDEHYQRTKRHFDIVSQQPSIHYLASELYWRERSWTIYRRLLMPLSDDGLTVNMMIAAAFYEPRESCEGELHRLDETVSVRELENVATTL